MVHDRKRQHGTFVETEERNAVLVRVPPEAFEVAAAVELFLINPIQFADEVVGVCFFDGCCLPRIEIQEVQSIVVHERQLVFAWIENG